MKYFDVGKKFDVYLHNEKEEGTNLNLTQGINIILFRVFMGPSVTGVKVYL